MKLDSHVSSIRTLLKQFTDDTLYTNEFLANMLVSARNSIYDLEFIKKGRNFSRFSYNSFCIKLVRETFHDCNCVPNNLGCQVLKSEITLPKVLIDTKGNLMLNIYTINGNRIDYKKFQDRKLLKTHPVTNRIMSYDILDQRLVIFGNLNLVTVIIEAVWENPFELFGIPNCDNSGNILNSLCWDPLEAEFPQESLYDIPIYSLVLKMLGVKTEEDNSENAQNNTN